MALGFQAVGRTTNVRSFDYDFRDVIRYALSVGANSRAGFAYLYEGNDARGPLVLPTFISVPAFSIFGDLLELCEENIASVVHERQTLRMHKPLQPSGRLSIRGRVNGVYDLKRMATSEFTTEVRDEAGELLAEFGVGVLFHGAGGFGGERPPRAPKVIIPESAPDFVLREGVPDDAAFLYRLNGDLNPLHVDSAVAKLVGFDRPILHGLCTWGYVGRAVVQALCPNEPHRLTALDCQFRAPVFPGDTLVVEGWRDGAQVALRVSTEQNLTQTVLLNASASVS